MWFRFRAVEIRFYDAKKGGLIFKVGQYQDNPFSNENAELDALFKEISSHFSPGEPNPFTGDKPGSATAAVTHPN